MFPCLPYRQNHFHFPGVGARLKVVCATSLSSLILLFHQEKHREIMLFQVEGTGLVGEPECNRCIKHLTSEVKNLSIIDGKDDFRISAKPMILAIL